MTCVLLTACALQFGDAPGEDVPTAPDAAEDAAEDAFDAKEPEVDVCDADTRLDPTHCGECGRTCPWGQGCWQGDCEPALRMAITLTVHDVELVDQADVLLGLSVLTASAGGDALCSDAHGSDYKALLAVPGQRDPTPGAQLDWVLAPNQLYVRKKDGVTIGKTTADAVFEFPLAAPPPGAGLDERWSLFQRDQRRVDGGRYLQRVDRGVRPGLRHHVGARHGDRHAHDRARHHQLRQWHVAVVRGAGPMNQT